MLLRELPTGNVPVQLGFQGFHTCLNPCIVEGRNGVLKGYGAGILCLLLSLILRFLCGDVDGS